MNYTRRLVLRNAALLSLATAADYSSLAFLSGCKKPKPLEYFPDGVRIFFAGAWLFCADPDPTLMRAVSVDMPSLPHIFPYGVWHDKWDDSSAPRLDENRSGATPLIPYPVTVTGTLHPAPDLPTLFSSAQDNSPFTYLPNNDKKLTIDWTHPTLRVISMPLPTRIVPAAFRTDASINDGNGHCHPGPTGSTKGVATTHIFEYDGASILTFQPPGADLQSMTHSTDSRADYHFHTVPSFEPGFDHGPCMFDNLLSIVHGLEDRTGLGLLTTQKGEVIFGPNVPTCVDHWELEIPEQNKTHRLASCASGGGGLNG